MARAWACAARLAIGGVLIAHGVGTVEVEGVEEDHEADQQRDDSSESNSSDAIYILCGYRSNSLADAWRHFALLHLGFL